MHTLQALRRWFVTVVVLCVVMLSVGLGMAKKTTSPPQSSSFGKTLTEWMRTYWEHWSAGTLDEPVGRVVLLEPPDPNLVSGSGTSEDPAVLVGTRELEIMPGSPFVLPMIVWLGETYDPAIGQPDDPVLDASFFTESNARVTLDGEVLIDSDRDDLSRYYFGPVLYDPPLFYAEPTSYGSIGVIFVQGLGFVHPPLPPGKHVLRLQSELIALVPDYYGEGVDLDVGVRYDNTWILRVDPRR